MFRACAGIMYNVKPTEVVYSGHAIIHYIMCSLERSIAQFTQVIIDVRCDWGKS